MNRKTSVSEKDERKVKLGIRDRISMLKNKRAFSLIFPFVILLFIIVLFSILTKGRFFTANVFKGIFNQSLIVGTLAIGMTFVFTTGDVDFSVGNVMGLAAAVGALHYQTSQNIVSTIILTILSGILLMLCNYTLSVALHIKSAMVAIIGLTLYASITQQIVGAETLKVDYNLCRSLDNGGFRYISFILFFGLCLVVYYLTPVGRQLRFIGGNSECARQTGINITRVRCIGFLLAGLGIGLAGVYQIIRTGSVSNSVGNGMGMDVMLATVLGGMSIFGGAKSNAYSGFTGALTICALNQGLLMIGVSSMLIQGVRGVIFLILVVLNSERAVTLPSRQQF